MVAIRKPLRDQSPRRGTAVPLRFTKQRERILDAATPLLNAKGVCGMTLHEVAAALGLQTSSVTYYYRYKEQLAAAVIEDSLQQLGAYARTAAAAASPRLRVAAFINLYFDQQARALRGEARPLAVLSEIRTFDSAVRDKLIADYQAVFRVVRSFFGEWSSEVEKNLFTVRAQVLNESLFWTAIWLGRHPASECPAVARRMFDILERGLLTISSPLPAATIEPERESETASSLQHSAFLRVATRLINEIGYKGASIDRISSELNVTRGSFYHHIDTKSDLVLDC
ncbi:MAG: TetR/AcrR family transcriptional regulator, partial [Gammaproteobacteria bacterium]|nr:TetR/AcrR family transcriptional regulator [Gammaproteobacteria bacterium]